MMQCTVCHKPYIGPKNHYVCTYCGASIESPVDLKKDPDHLRDVLRKGSEDGIWGYRDFFTVPEDENNHCLLVPISFQNTLTTG